MAPGLIRSTDNRADKAAGGVFLLKTLAAAMPGSPSESELAFLIDAPSRRRYFTSMSGQLYLIRILPRKDFETLSVIAEPLARIRETINNVVDQFPGVEIGLTGKHVLLADQLRIASRDALRATLLSVVLVTLVFVVAMRSVARPLLVIVALACGIAWTVGMVTLMIGQLGLLSAVFMPILIGAGIDYGIHVLVRYEEEREHLDVEAAICRALESTGRGNVTAAMTSAGAFLTTTLTQSHALREVGWVAAMGLLLCLVALLTVLPAMIVWHDRRTCLDNETTRPVRHDWLSTLLPQWSPRRARNAAMVSMLVLIALVPGVRYVRFEDNLLKLQPPGLPCVDWQNRMLADSSAAGLFAAVRCESLAQVGEIVAAASQSDHVGMTESVLDLVTLPDAERQQLRTRLHRYHDVAVEPGKPAGKVEANDLRRAARAVDRLTRYAEDADIAAEGPVPLATDTLTGLADTLRSMSRTLDDAPAELADQLVRQMNARLAQVGQATTKIVAADTEPLAEVLPAGLRHAYVSDDGEFLVRIYPQRSAWDMRHLDEFIDEVRAITPDVTGTAVIQLENLHDLRKGFRDASLMAAVVVVVLVWCDFRRLGDTRFAVLPLSVGLLGTIGAMGWLGWDFNVTNFIAVPILIGLGVDQGIHIVHRYRDSAEPDTQLRSTRTAVILTAVTTMIGFGSLLTADHLGALSLGQVMVVGTLSCLIASLILLPPLIRWARSQPTKH
ncbi:MAG: MMPL family transporter [Pirellulales bacterium]